MSYKGKYYPRYPKKYKGDPRNIIYRSLWERKFMNYCDLTETISEWQSEEFWIPYRSPIDNRIHRYFPDFFVKYIDKQGKKRTIYSLRHTYATFRLENNVDIYHLARQMGTSSQMIMNHYGQTRGKYNAKHITQTKFTKTTSKKTISKELVKGLHKDQ